MRGVWLLVIFSGCSAKPAHTPRPPAIAAARADAPAPDAPPPPTCTTGDAIGYFGRDGREHAIACMKKADEIADCWTIDASGRATFLPTERWPDDASDRSYGPGDEWEPLDGDSLRLRAVSPFKAVVHGDPTTVHTIDICKGDACSSIQIKRDWDRGTEELHHITIARDGSLVAIGWGEELHGAKVTELYDLPSGQFRAYIPMREATCTEVIGMPAGNLLVLRGDCANNGGELLLYTPTTRLVAKLGAYAGGMPYFALGNDRYLFVGFDDLVVWDLRLGKQLANRPMPNDDVGRRVAAAGATLLELRDDGTIARLDPIDLATTDIGKLPRCP